MWKYFCHRTPARQHLEFPGNSHIKMMPWGFSSHLLGVRKAGVVHLRVKPQKNFHSGSFSGFFRGLSRNKYDRKWCVVLELLPLRGEKHFKLRPQHRSLVHLKVLLEKILTSTLVLFVSESYPNGFKFANVTLSAMLKEFAVEVWHWGLWRVKWRRNASSDLFHESYLTFLLTYKTF